MHYLENIIQEILGIIISYNPKADLDLVRKAHAHVASALAGLRLRNGAPALLRPLAAAKTLALLRVDETVVAAGLLYDTAMDDGSAACGNIRMHFGQEAAEIVAGVLKINRMTFLYAEQRASGIAKTRRMNSAFKGTHKEQSPDEHIYKIQLAISEDIRVLLVVLADHMHKLHSLDCLPSHRRERIIRETMEIYLPLVSRLGLGAIEKELEDITFRQLLPDVYDRISGWLEKRRPFDEKYVSEVVGMLRGALETAGIQAALVGGVKRVYNIYKEQTAHTLNLDEIDAVTVAVVVKDMQRCYEALGMTHSVWKPVPGMLRDHIATPTANMRQELRTTVIGPGERRVKVRIKTEIMDLRSERGLTSLWWDEAGGLLRPREACRFDWLRGKLEMEQRPPRRPPICPAPGAIVVFTPKGAVQALPRGATPVDFAYRIHTELGNHCLGAKVDGKLVSLGTELHSNATVEIIAHAKGCPKSDWLESVKTGKARKCIRRFLRMEERNRNIEPGLSVRNKEIRMKTKVLTICTGNRDRSPTAKALCGQYANLEARSAGVSKYAKTPLTEEMVRETDVLIVMESGHAEHIFERYPEAAKGKPIYCLDIPDEFRSMDPILVRMLRERLKPIIEQFQSEIALEAYCRKE